MSAGAIAAVLGAPATVPVQPAIGTRTAAGTTGAASTTGSAFAAALARASGHSSPASTTAGVTAGRSGAAPGLAGRVLLDTGLRHLGTTPATRPAGDDGGAGFVAEVHRRVGVLVPDDVAGQATVGVPVPSLAQARSGDVVVVGGTPPQVGLYAGGGRLLHAPPDGGPVRLSAIEGPVMAIRRVVSSEPADVTGASPPPSRATAALSPAAALAARATATATTGTGTGTGTGLAGVPFAELFQRAGAEHGIDPALLAAVARVESSFNPSATSRAGAVGLMQFMPATAASLGVNPRDPASAIDGAARYLRQGLDRFGTVELALAAYNAGPGAVQRHGGIPPYPETQAYVRKVVDAKEQYR